ncbi:hypothetical protein CTB91_00413 [Dickeya solani]|uniref:Uncharacterized protein n=1 Tax=Dickeya solani D s0432-1 TaxID=1231725 RepID=A0AAV3KF74_9GAMM|nr:hypothetical protein CTB91_00413 [Dickeya solani]ERO59438.1 hypothetical protein A544_0410 [Dickeya solani D s0432-1]AYQ50442.1 hypothetical protein DSOL99_00418 [Dickeya solani]MBD3604109.1 hypothetical protein [Dickeya solani]NUA38443.1 hypothetical protein [Dickeya solani]
MIPHEVGTMWGKPQMTNTLLVGHILDCASIKRPNIYIFIKRFPMYTAITQPEIIPLLDRSTFKTWEVFEWNS